MAQTVKFGGWLVKGKTLNEVDSAAHGRACEFEAKFPSKLAS